MKDKSNEWQNQAEDEMGEARERLGQGGRQRGQQQGQQRGRQEQGRPGERPSERGREGGMRDMDDTAEQEMGERFDRDFEV
jgi:hypothetical protein